jgi:hypothetical protein
MKTQFFFKFEICVSTQQQIELCLLPVSCWFLGFLLGLLFNPKEGDDMFLKNAG